ncbi:hypothetical protein CRYUN_Cryun09bG0008500 [Craigia yunnanensis]
MLERLDQKALQEFSFVTWFIWKDRNEVVHGGDTKPVDRVARFVKQYIRDFNYAQLRSAENNSKPPERWKPPTIGFVKINFDGAWVSENKKGDVEFERDALAVIKKMLGREADFSTI